MKQLILALILLFCFHSFSQQNNTLIDKLISYDQILTSALNNPSISKDLLDSLNRDLYNLNPETLENSSLIKDPDKTLKKIYELKLKIFGIFETSEISDNNKAQLELNLRKLILSLQYIEDMLIESYLKIDLNTTRQVLPFENSKYLNTNINTRILDKDSNFDINSFQSGDILLIRGSSTISSSVSRISEVPSVFSHLAIVYIDEKSGDKFVLESLSHIVLIARSLPDMLSKPMARIAVLRPKDEQMGKDTAQFVYNEIIESNKRGKPYGFDFSMSMENNCRFFCSKVIAWGYEKVSNGSITLPSFKSKIQRTNSKFMETFGLGKTTVYSFSPTDILFDSRFKLIHEYRDPYLDSNNRLKDLIADKIFSWMDQGYDFNLGFFKEKALYIMSKLLTYKMIKKILLRFDKHVDEHFPTSIVRTLAGIHILLNAYEKAIAQEYSEYQVKNNYPMPPKKVYALIERARKLNPKLSSLIKFKAAPNNCLVHY